MTRFAPTLVVTHLSVDQEVGGSSPPNCTREIRYLFIKFGNAYAPDLARGNARGINSKKPTGGSADGKKTRIVASWNPAMQEEELGEEDGG
jgi:hypothetical protein